MSLQRVLRDLATAVEDEAAQNPEFARKLVEILERGASQASRRTTLTSDETGRQRTRRHRRASAVLDPVALATESEDVLRSQLASLSLDQLKDVVAEYGMDQAKLVMRWRTPARVIEKIVEISMGRSRKGDAFRS